MKGILAENIILNDFPGGLINIKGDRTMILSYENNVSSVVNKIVFRGFTTCRYFFDFLCPGGLFFINGSNLFLISKGDQYLKMDSIGGVRRINFWRKNNHISKIKKSIMN